MIPKTILAFLKDTLKLAGYYLGKYSKKVK